MVIPLILPTVQDHSIFRITTAWLLAASASHVESVSWGYQVDTVDELPPQGWLEVSSACNGSRQSPIYIDSSAAKSDSGLSPMKYLRYDVTTPGHKWIVWNNGHTAQFTGLYASPPEIYGAGLATHYILTQFHFHWGADDKRGSEHSIDTKRYPLELHMVHRRSTDFDAQALSDPIGMAVVAVLFDVINETEPPNKHIDQLLEVLSQDVAANSSVTVTLANFKLQDLLPDSPAYYRYTGSLTTPPCAEAVVWTVLKQPLKVTETQLNLFRALKTAVGGNQTSLVNNYRPQQRLNGRVVTMYNGPDVTSATSNWLCTTTNSMVVFLFAVIVQLVVPLNR